jgi:OOP family OmpA-OmpF porin
LQGKLTLTGFYPDADSHAALLAAAAKNFPGLEVIDTMQPGAGAPKAFGEAAVSGLEKLAQLREGALDLSDRSARLIGEAADDGLADEIRAGLIGSLPSGFAVDTLLTSPARELPALEPNAAGAPVAAAPPDPKPTAQPAAPMEAAACQAQMAALVKDRPIQFASGSAQILPESVSTLRALAEAASKCPQVNFEIAGHTDDVGRVSRNEDLSRRRAESVLVYLVASGVEPQRLSAAGYGEHRPLVPNDNDENRAKNRRIEFNVK